MRRPVCWMVLLALLGLAQAAAAFQVRPVRLAFDSRVAASQLTVHNPGPRPLLLQAQAFDWGQQGGEEQLTPTQALIVSPPIVEIAPGASQVLRVGLRQPLVAGVERSHRIWLSQVATPGDIDTGVQLLMRVSLPVFVTGTATPPALPQWQRQGETLALHNGGGRHLHVRAMQLRSAQGLTRDFGPCYALPGQPCRWDLPAGWSATDTHYEADTSAGALSGSFDAAVQR